MLLVVGVAVAVAVVWVLGPGAKWWLVHVDGVKVGGKDGLAGKDLADALDTVRGRAMALGTGLLAAVAIYYTASNATSARRSAHAAIEGVEAARRSAEATEEAQLRTFELTQAGQRQSEEVQRRTFELTQAGQRQSEVAQRRTHELTEQGQRTDRFTAAVAQLGDASPAIQLGGVYALAGVADDSPTREFRQNCIDVLCAYLRLPYDPYPGDRPADGQDLAEHAEALKGYRAARQVRHTVIRIIGDHLREGAAVSWQGHALDFTDVVFDGVDLHEAVFDGGTVSFRGVTFLDTTSFTGVRFERGTVDFSRARFGGDKADFGDASFKGGTVDFTGVAFERGEVTFSRSRFMGATVSFVEARFDCSVSYSAAHFEAGTVAFSQARFDGGTVAFSSTSFTGSTVDFGAASFADGCVTFSQARLKGGTVCLRGASFEGGRVILGDTLIEGGTLDLGSAQVMAGTLDFLDTQFNGGTADFRSIGFKGGTTNFNRAWFGDSEVDFTDAKFGDGTVEFALATGRRPRGLPDDLAAHLS
ncbi:pentapeptide repeat-containing protein [Actinomadura citrea]|uniref:pentapeptide repeat-containing protein n=1 Tax=Actinomadura citrea TaxID=46158 RepID=UPI003CE50B19